MSYCKRSIGLFIVILLSVSGCFNQVDKNVKGIGVNVISKGDVIKIFSKANVYGSEVEINHQISPSLIKSVDNLVIVKSTNEKTTVSIIKYGEEIKSGNLLFTIEDIPVNIEVKLIKKFDSIKNNNTNVKRTINETLLGDFNDDDKVDIFDFKLFVDVYGKKDSDEGYLKKYDISDASKGSSHGWNEIFATNYPDGKIDIFDFIIFGANYGLITPILNDFNGIRVHAKDFTHIWAWDKNQNYTDGKWPGLEMNYDENGWSSFEFDNISNLNIVFSNNGKNQTLDLSLNKKGEFWYNGFWAENYNDTWDNRIFTHKITSTIDTIKSRNINVILPPNYNRNKEYETLYMMDGQNCLDSDSFGNGGWQAHRAITNLTNKDLINPCILVTIDNTVDRIYEYSPVPYIKNPGTPGGGADKYIQYIKTNIIPFVENKYSSSKDNKKRYIAGSSFGGLISFYASWKYPDIFSKAICMSSFFIWKEDWILDEVKSEKVIPDIKLYIDSGDLFPSYPHDNFNDDGKAITEKMKDILLSKGFQMDIDLKHLYFEGHEHSEPYWRERFPDSLIWLLGK